MEKEREIKTNAIYKHFKGDLYLVEDIVYHSETKEKLVLYRALYKNCVRYVRSYEMFISKVDKKKYPNVKQVYRFELQNLESAVGCKEPNEK